MITTQKPPKAPGLSGLMTAQFIGAFNDNAWKLIVFTIATRWLMIKTEGDQELLHRSSQLIATLSLVTFLIPMLLVSIPAGYLADRFSKRTIIILMKGLGFFLMGLSTLSLFLMPQSYYWPFILLGCMGAQSGLFSPAKYGILSEILPEEKLTKGNGLLEMWTMMAIIAGTGLGPILLMPDKGGSLHDRTWIAPGILTVLALIALLTALFIPKVPPANTSGSSLITEMKRAGRTILGNRTLAIAILGSFAYWVITCLIGQNVLVYAKSLIVALEKGEVWQGIPPACYGLGIAIGAVVAGKLSGDGIEKGLIPLGAVGFSITTFVLGIVQPGMWGTVAVLLFTGLSSGLLIVPLHAIIQKLSPQDQRGSILALENIIDILGMLMGSGFAALMAWLGLELGVILIVSAILVFGVMTFAINLLHDNFLRLGWTIATRCIFRLRLLGSDAKKVFTK